MSGLPEATRQVDWVMPPLAGSDGKVAGAVLAVTTTAANIDLTTVPLHPAGYPAEQLKADPNVFGHYVRLDAQGGDVFVIFGPTQANVSGANAPNPATTGTNVVGLCAMIPAGQSRDYKLPDGNQAPGGPVGANSPCRWLAYVTATGTATLRIMGRSP